MSTSPAKPLLSPEQLERLAKLGEERQAAVGDLLFKAGDRRYPFIVILEGEVAIQDPDGHEVIRHGSSGFLGEISLLSGQTAYLSAVVTEPTRYLAIDREQLRPLLSEDGA
jgi:thioredoxin reductase (NADPH)